MTETAYKDALHQIYEILENVGIPGQLPQVPDPNPDQDPDGEPPKPWFGSRWAPWAIPSRRIPDHPQNHRYLQEFLRMCDGGINLNTHSWAIAKYYFDDDTPRTDGMEIRYPSWCNLTNSFRMPWDPNWRHASDGDSLTTLVEKETGRCYLIWQTRYDRARNIMRCGTASVVMAGYRPRGGAVANIWTKGNGFQPSRAVGIAQPHMLITREEMDDGLIPHCLALALPKPSRDTRVPPATKHIGRTGSPESGRMGMGFRIAFDGLTDGDVDAWAEDFHESVRHLLVVIARAVKDYGFLLVDNGGNGRRGSVFVENDITARWDEIGLTREVTTFALHGLIRPNLGKARILAEPVFPGGSMDRTARYDGVDYPDGF